MVDSGAPPLRLGNYEPLLELDQLRQRHQRLAPVPK